MKNKITEIITEPSKLYVGSYLKLKVKVIRYMTCKEMASITCEASHKFSCGEVRGL